MKHIYQLLLVVLLVFAAPMLYAQITSNASGNWSDGNTWVGGVVPDTANNVVIAAGHTVTVDVATAKCANISFGSSTAKLAMGSGAVLNVYGNFTLATTTHTVFSSWAAGAKLRFTGYATTQTISGWPTGTGSSASIMEMQIDKPTGTVTTGANNMRLYFGDSLDVKSGTFQLGLTDDIEAKNLSGTGTDGVIVIRAGATFTVQAGASHIRKGTFTDTVTARMGKLTVYGTASLVTTSSNMINFVGVDIENGGVVNISTGGTANYLNLNFITVKSGGSLVSNTTTRLYHTTAYVVVQSGSEFESTTSTTPVPTLGMNISAGTVRYSRSDVQTLPAGLTTYNNLIFSGSGVKTLGVNTAVNGTFSIRGSASLALGSFTLTYGGSAVLQYGSSGQVTAQTTADAEWPASSGPANVTVYNSGGVTMHANRTISGTLTLSSGSFDNDGSLNDKVLTLGNGATIRRAAGSITAAPTFGSTVNIEYYSSVSQVTTSFEVPAAASVLNNLTVSSTQGIILGGNVTVNGALSMTGSNITTNANVLAAATTATISRTSGKVVGNFRWMIPASTVSNLLYPIGTSSAYYPATLSYTGAPSSGGYVTAFFTASNPGTNGVDLSASPIDDNGYSIDRVSADGYWTLAAGGGLTADGTYSLDLAAEGFAAVSDYANLRLLKRANATSNWAASGTHASGTGSNSSPVVRRTGITSGFSEFGIGSNSANNPLPVELQSFTGAYLNGKVVLRWSTILEANTSQFVVEKLDQESWLAIGSVRASGNSNSPKSYSFTDGLANGMPQYRLKVVDNDGTLAYSAIIQVSTELPRDFVLYANYPNPFNPATVIRFSLPQAAHARVAVFNVAGEQVTVLADKEFTAGFHEVAFTAVANGAQLASGTYFAVLTSGGKMLVQPMLLAK